MTNRIEVGERAAGTPTVLPIYLLKQYQSGFLWLPWFFSQDYDSSHSKLDWNYDWGREHRHIVVFVQQPIDVGQITGSQPIMTSRV